MEKDYIIVNDVSLAEKEKEEVPASEEIKPDKIVAAEEPVTEEAKVELPTVEETVPVTEAPVEVPVAEPVVAEIPVAPVMDPAPEIDMTSVIPTIPVDDSYLPTEPAFTSPSFEQPSYDTTSYGNYSEPALSENMSVFKTEQDIDKFASGLTNDVNKLIDEKAIVPMKQTVAINNRLLAWGKQVVETGLNKALFDEFEEIENMYNETNTATYDNEVSETTPSYESSQIDNIPTFGDQDNNTFGGMNLAA